MSDYNEMKKLISYTNNGKILITAVPYPLRSSIPALIAEGKLKRATFMAVGDAVKLA